MSTTTAAVVVTMTHRDPSRGSIELRSQVRGMVEYRREGGAWTMAMQSTINSATKFFTSMGYTKV